MTATLSIGDVARRAGVATSAIRFYERTGLLPEPERVSGRRRYRESALQRLRVIAVAKEAGFTLDEIRLVLTDFDAERPASEQWRPFVEAKLEELDALSRRIEAMRALLRRGLDCGCLTAEDCKLLS